MRINFAAPQLRRADPAALNPTANQPDVQDLQPSWYAYSGVPRPNDPTPPTTGLYLSATVPENRQLAVSNVHMDKQNRVLTFTVGTQGDDAPGPGRTQQKVLVANPRLRWPESWTVVVRDTSGEVLYSRPMTLGLPPPP